MSKAPDSFKLNTYELPRRAGEMKEYELDIIVKEKFGVDLISVPAGEVIEVDARLESVTEGIFLFLQKYPTIVPFFTAFNKIYFCRLSHFVWYMDEIEKFLQHMQSVTKNYPAGSYSKGSIGRYVLYSVNEYAILKELNFYREKNA